MSRIYPHCSVVYVHNNMLLYVHILNIMYSCAYFVLYMYVLKHISTIMDRICTQYVHKCIQYANGGSILSILVGTVT